MLHSQSVNSLLSLKQQSRKRCLQSLLLCFQLTTERNAIKENKARFFGSVAESVRNTPSTDTMPASSSQPCAEHPDPEGSAGSYLAAAPEEDAAQPLPTAHVRPSHPLKSFAVPAVPPAGSAYDPALPSTPLLTQQGEPGKLPKREKRDFKMKRKAPWGGNRLRGGSGLGLQRKYVRGRTKFCWYTFQCLLRYVHR